MNKVIIVSKTHLDLGFTDLANNVLNRYINEFIPNSIAIAEEVNTSGKKFVWTLGSWIINEALERGTPEQREKLSRALSRGDIVPHGYPFTTHTELLDKDTLEYGMSIVKDLDKKFGRKTIAAKMTDVPGHTIGLVPILADAGIKLLHIGVNGASALPNVPECFLWKYGENEVIVIYDASYGGEHKNEFIDDILYFDHSLDNRGPRNAKGVLLNYQRIKAKYPGYEVVAGSLDDYAELLWKEKDKLPVITSEIGDTWIHGASTDPYKVGAMRTLQGLKNEWLKDGTLKKDSEEYRKLCNGILCVAEHTWGMDTKIFFGDYYNYLRKDFDEAREKDIKIKRGGIYNLPFAKSLRENAKRGVYSTIEKSWQEQREYLDKALNALSDEHRSIAQDRLQKLVPKEEWEHFDNALQKNNIYKCSDFEISFNDFGGIEVLKRNGKAIIKSNSKPLLEYRSYGKSDYSYWLHHYTRNLNKTRVWAVGDFARPMLGRVDSKFPKGVFNYKMEKGSYAFSEKELTVIINLSVDDKCYKELGAPRKAQIKYVVDGEKVRVYFKWLGKPANRLTESICLNFYPDIDKNSVKFIKCGSQIDALNIAENGNRKISAAEECLFTVEGNEYILKNPLSPLVTSGNVNILHFDNKYNDYINNGISFLLHNNVWGTNFPLWYGENAYFEFELCENNFH